MIGGINMIIGICGKSGSGKSTLANELVQIYSNNAIHLDIDKIGHKVLSINDVKEELKKSFGNYIISGTSIDRKKLGEMVFNSREEMKKLSDITWKYMQIEIDEFLDKNKSKTIILDWLLLPITKYFSMCDLTILLDIPYEIRKQRAMKRDNISEDAFDLREQASIDFKRENFDYVLQDNSKEEIRKLVKTL